MGLRIAFVLLVAVAQGLTATDLWGQAVSGRRRAGPTVADESPPDGRDDRPRWFFALGAGAMASGDLFRVQTRDLTSTNWQAPGGPSFNSRDFVVTLDENIALAVAMGRRMSERSWVRLSLSTAQVDMTALARVGQGAEIYRWDRMDLVVLGLDFEYRLISQARYPYLLGGGALIAASGAADDAIDQTRIAARVGGGYHVQLNPIWGLRAEARGHLATLTFDDYEPPVAEGYALPEIATSSNTPHQFWEILLMLHAVF